MILINLKEADLKENEDIIFLYEIIKYRWKYNDVINITHRTNTKLPSYEEHIYYLNNNNYLKHYIIYLGELKIGSCYIDKDHVYGLFILPFYLKKALKKYGIQNTELNIRPEPISVIAFKKMIELNSNITTFYAKVNPKNILSRRVMIDGGHEEIEIILKQKTINGKLVGGNWPDAYENIV
jgi:hypothetical protein